jgi:hypothetical protein
MLHTILKILRLLLQHQIELSNKIDDLMQNTFVDTDTVIDSPTVDEIVGELELLDDTLQSTKF